MARRRKHDRLKSLECFEAMHARVAAGHDVSLISRWVQGEMKEALELTPKSLEVSIGRYKKDLTTFKVAEDLLGFKLEGYKISGLNEVDEVERLYRLQLSRIEIGVMAEKKVGGINKLLALEVSTALELLRRSHEIKMDQG